MTSSKGRQAMGSWKTRPEIGQDELPRAVFDAVDTGLIVVDGDHRVIACNAWFTSAARIGAEEAIGRTIEELFPQTGTGRLTSAVAEALKYGTSRILTHSLHPALLPLKTRAGRVLIHDVTVGPGGREPTVHCLIQIFNVTVAAERDRVLRERQNARFDAVVDSALDVIVSNAGR
jgi:PAS domain-containing protein